MGSLPGYLEEVLHSSIAWDESPQGKMVGHEVGIPHRGWVMNTPRGIVFLEYSLERHDWEAVALVGELANFSLCLKRTEAGLEMKWSWPRGKFRTSEVDQVLGRGLKKIIREKGGPEVCLLGGMFRLILEQAEVSIAMQSAMGESGDLWLEKVPYSLANDLLTDLQVYLEANLGKPVF